MRGTRGGGGGKDTYERVEPFVARLVVRVQVRDLPERTGLVRELPVLVDGAHLQQENEHHGGDELAGSLQLVGFGVVEDGGSEDAVVERVPHLGRKRGGMSREGDYF